MQECSNMFGIIFNINLLKYFYKKVILDDDIIYLFFKTGILGDIINLYQYKCTCGEYFGIENRKNKFQIKHCPYCGLNIEDNIKESLLGRYDYIMSGIE